MHLLFFCVTLGISYSLSCISIGQRLSIQSWHNIFLFETCLTVAISTTIGLGITARLQLRQDLCTTALTQGFLDH